MTRLSRLLVGAAELLMVLLYVLPLWHVRLVAPQYPEGLGMHIYISSVQGATENDLTNINNLNHYIGMKRIENDTIPELRFMPWILGGLILTGLGAAAVGRRQAVAGEDQAIHHGVVPSVLDVVAAPRMRWISRSTASARPMPAPARTAAAA